MHVPVVMDMTIQHDALTMSMRVMAVLLSMLKMSYTVLVMRMRKGDGFSDDMLVVLHTMLILTAHKYMDAHKAFDDHDNKHD